MKLFIPTIGTKLKLLSEWTARIHTESRNMKFLETHSMLSKDFLHNAKSVYHLRFAAEVVFKVDRIYIRQNMPDFDSITFKVEGLKNNRFWVKLANANEMDVESGSNS